MRTRPGADDAELTQPLPRVVVGPDDEAPVRRGKPGGDAGEREPDADADDADDAGDAHEIADGDVDVDVDFERTEMLPRIVERPGADADTDVDTDADTGTGTGTDTDADTGTGTGTDADADADTETGEPAAEEGDGEPPSDEAGKADRGALRKRRRSGVIALGVLALVLALLAGLWTVPSVKTALRQSFTRLPTGYTELYFTATPSVNGIELSLPVAVVAHATAANSVTLKVWLVDAAGAVDSSELVTLTPKGGVAKSVITVKVTAKAQVVYVRLLGHTETLHYRISGSAFPSPSPSSSTQSVTIP